MPKKCKKCKVPLEGFMYKWIAAKIFGIKPSEKDPEACNKCEGELAIDLEELKRAEDRQTNPYLKEYHSKLKELLQIEISSKDNFINWITGLSGGAFLFIAQNEQLIDAEGMALSIGGALLFCAFMSAIFFKMFLDVRYGSLRLEEKLCRLLWEEHEIRRQIEEEKGRGEVCKKTREKLIRNQKESRAVQNPKHKEITVTLNFIGYRLLDIFYLLTIGLFVSGFICIGKWYFNCSLGLCF